MVDRKVVVDRLRLQHERGRQRAVRARLREEDAMHARVHQRHGLAAATRARACTHVSTHLRTRAHTAYNTSGSRHRYASSPTHR